MKGMKRRSREWSEGRERMEGKKRGKGRKEGTGANGVSAKSD